MKVNVSRRILLGALGGHVHAQHPRALAREQDRRRLAVAEPGPARAGSGDDRDLPGESIHYLNV